MFLDYKEYKYLNSVQWLIKLYWKILMNHSLTAKWKASQKLYCFVNTPTPSVLVLFPPLSVAVSDKNLATDSKLFCSNTAAGMLQLYGLSHKIYLY